MTDVTFTEPTDKVTVIRWTTSPTDSDDLRFYIEEITMKEWAIIRIKEQPFYA
jgi:hypothetical protein